MTTCTDKPLMLILNKFCKSGKKLLPKTYESDIDSHGE